ncbi:MAG: hypothetical protein M1816_007168 [Peltula sp. TS41687]|nr:MAG: hypothetical protein M1816_007168 [Peltula sp. TS41687]
MTTVDLLWDISFVVAGTQLSRATSVLSGAGLRECLDKNCAFATVASQADRRIYPTPAVHFHLNEEEELSSQLTVQLHRQEDRLWELQKGFDGKGPYLTNGPSQDLILASDASLPLCAERPYRGEGRFPDSLAPVRIPTPHRFLESMILLSVKERDLLRSNLWEVWIGYMLDYIIDNGLLQVSLLDEPFRRYVEAAHAWRPLREIVDEAERALGERASRTPTSVPWYSEWELNLQVDSLSLGLSSSKKLRAYHRNFRGMTPS